MANWVDFLSLIVTVSVFGGVIYGVVFLVQSINEGLKSTKESLKQKGVDISASGVSVKTSKRFDREDYVDATQRGLIKTMNAASFKRSDSIESSSAPKMERGSSYSSTKSAEEKKKKKSVFAKNK
ncbi:hypothetical protein D9613_003210 [Agrocybe pediades]|uniref:Uncharacterized protein n=1 Tax=Agrocybe pediades TaxID=84607 RepID=A0A8H4VL00_9AGAR|nr:hypothetical protein D9613_003210 [Agrocybe pediades]